MGGGNSKAIKCMTPRIVENKSSENSVVMKNHKYGRNCLSPKVSMFDKYASDYAEAINQIMIELFPVSWEALSNKFKSH